MEARVVNIGSALLPTWKIYIDGYKKPFRVAAMDKRDAKRVAHEMMQNNRVKIKKIVKEELSEEILTPDPDFLELTDVQINDLSIVYRLKSVI